MRIRSAGLAVLLALPALPGIATAQDAPAASESAPQAEARRPNPYLAVVRSARRPDHSRVAIVFPGPVPAHDVTRTAAGVEIRFRVRQGFDLGSFRPVTDVSGASVVREGGTATLRLALPCDCEVDPRVEGQTLRLYIRRGEEAAAQPAALPPAPAASPPAVQPAPAAAPLAVQPAPAAGPPAVQPAPAAASPAAQPTPPAAATAQAGAPITLRTARRPDHFRLALDFDRGLPPHAVRNSDGSTEIRVRGAYRLDMAQFKPLAEIGPVSISTEGADSVIRFPLGCTCTTTTEASQRTLHVLFRRGPAARAETPVTIQARGETLRAASQAAASAGTEITPPAPAATPAPAPAAAPAAPQPRGRQRQQAQPAAPTAEEVNRLRESIVQQLGVLNGTVPAPPRPARTGEQPAPGASPGQAAQGQAPQAGSGQPAAAPAGQANAAPPSNAPSAPGAPSPMTPQQLREAAARAAANGRPAAPARPACAPDFDPATWGSGATGKDHAERLVGFRRALAASAEAPEEAAAFAEYLLSLGLLPEAMEVLRERGSEEVSEATRLRLQRVRDVARLLRRRPIDPASPLLAEKPNCDREDLALWQALAASANRDSAAIAPLMPRVQRALRAAPDRLRLAYAFALAEGVGDDIDTLRAIATPVRNAVATTEYEEASRNWLLARIAGLAGARDEERLYLRRAATALRTVPGLFAAARLAAREADRPAGSAATPDAQRAEARLIDIARTYRHDMLGEEAAVLYAQLLLNRGNLPSALVAADAASMASTRPMLESRGAALAARILRLLLVDPEGRTLPPPEERLAMFWGFEGYATPGERGDDIRMGAVKLMLERDLPDAALEVAREFAAATAQGPQGALLLARAEAAAPEGDPQKALAILRAQPLGEPGRRAAALALARLNRPADAAGELSGLRDRQDLSNRARYLFLAQRWTEAANTYAELLRDPGLDQAQRTEATGRYATAAALSPQQVARVPAELLSPSDNGTRSLLLLQAHEPPTRTAQQGARIELILNAIDRAKRIEAMAGATETR